MNNDIKEIVKETYSKLMRDEYNRLVLAVDYDKMQRIIDNLQQRIDKAICFIDTEEKIYEIKNTMDNSNVIDYIVDINVFKDKLIKILKGDE